MDQITMEARWTRGGMTREVAEQARRRRSSDRAATARSAETFGKRYPHQVSGGQLQRAMTLPWR
jgi:ABC-type dipeptide/oligopeptide/nickel transport system ATPase component